MSAGWKGGLFYSVLSDEMRSSPKETNGSLSYKWRVSVLCQELNPSVLVHTIED